MLADVSDLISVAYNLNGGTVWCDGCDSFMVIGGGAGRTAKPTGECPDCSAKWKWRNHANPADAFTSHQSISAVSVCRCRRLAGQRAEAEEWKTRFPSTIARMHASERRVIRAMDALTGFKGREGGGNKSARLKQVSRGQIDKWIAANANESGSHANRGAMAMHRHEIMTLIALGVFRRVVTEGAGAGAGATGGPLVIAWA